MKLALIVLLSIALQSNGARIVGGEDARAGQFPFSAAITAVAPGFTHFCGGALIDTQWILTAAQCVYSATSFTIRLGSVHLNGTDANRITVASSYHIAHPAFDPTTGLGHDIGLIRLRQPVRYSDYVVAASVGYLDLTEGVTVTATGWGQVDDSTPGTSNTLQYVKMDVVSNAECRLTYGEQVVDGMVCLAGNFNEGSCVDDVGSPAVLALGRYYSVLGISSFYSGNGCESTDPSGYTRILPYVQWIWATIRPEMLVEP